MKKNRTKSLKVTKIREKTFERLTRSSVAKMRSSRTLINDTVGHFGEQIIILVDKVDQMFQRIFFKKLHDIKFWITFEILTLDHIILEIVLDWLDCGEFRLRNDQN